MSVKKGVWSPEEDAKMIAYVSENGTGNWTAVPKKAGLRRCGKSCRLRWNNYLRPDLKHDNFTPQEEELIIKLHGAIGTRWSIIAQQLPGRTDNDVKNYWNCKLGKRLKDMGIDPVTHKPYSQILEDYENIGGLRKFDNGRIRSLNKDLKNAFTQIEGSSEEQIAQSSSITENTQMMQSEIRVLGGPQRQNQHESTHLLDQLQAIKKFTETPNNGKYPEIPRWGYSNSMMFSPATSSTSSSAYSTGNNPSLTGMNWKDYLLDDVFVPNDATQHDLTEYFTSDDTVDTQVMEAYTPVKNVADRVGGNYADNGMKCTSETSFLDEMLAGENEMMLLEFPSLLDDSTFEC